MYAITGITGKVGGAVARSLLAERLPVRAVLRDEAKAAEWRTRGCDIALAEMDDAASLTSAFRGAAGVFILPPSEFDPEPGFPEARHVIAAVTLALIEARPGKVVCLSTIGADAPHENLLTQRTLMEQSLPTSCSRWSRRRMSGAWPPRFSARTGAGRGSSNWRGPHAYRRTISPEPSPRC